MLAKVGPITLLFQKARSGGHLTLHHSTLTCHSYAGTRSFSSRHKSVGILEHSAVLVQDGLEIQELPWVVRRLNPREFPFAVGIAYTGDNHRTHQHEDDFNLRLRECRSVQQVLKILEVPGEKVTASSAAFALQRISQLQSVSTSDHDVESFVRKAVMHELCETVMNGLTTLNNDTLVSLAGCAALSSSNYDLQFTELVNEEVERRVGDALFSLSDLCSLIRVLSVGARGDVSVTENVWIHLGSRYKEIDAGNIADVYRVMRYIIPKAHYLWRVLERQLQLCWWKLTGEDIAAISSRVAVAGRQSTTTLKALGNWLHANIAIATDSEVRALLAAHADFDVIIGDGSFSTALERYIIARIAQMDRTAVAMAVDFFRRRRWLSTRVLDTVAADFEMNGMTCTPHEMLYTLRPFGQLNYNPPNSTAFFAAIERILALKLNEFDAATLLELLSSFIYIERFPVNFAKHIFTQSFLMQVKGIRDAGARQRAGYHLLLLQTAFLLECPSRQYLHELLTYDSLKLSLKWLEGRSFKLHQEVGQILRKLLGDDKVLDMIIPRYMAHVIDFQIFTDELQQPITSQTVSNIMAKENKDIKEFKRIAIISVMPEHYAINTSHLLGEYATKQRHLRSLGLNVVCVNYEVFMWKCRTVKDKMQYMKTLLSPHCHLLNSARTNQLQKEAEMINDMTDTDR